MNSASTKKRSDAIDMVKGLSIITLFFLHLENGYLNLEYNYFIVRSPAFYIVVGWLWGLSKNRRTVKEHWVKRLQGLVKPYIYFSLIFLAFDIIIIILQLKPPFILYRDLYKTFCLRGIGTLWFLPALLGGEIIFLYLRTKIMKIKILSTMAIIALLYLVSEGLKSDITYIDIISAPMKVIKDTCFAYIFICIAYFVSRRWGKRILNIKKQYLFTIGTLLLATSFCYANFIYIDRILDYILNGVLAGLGILLFFTAIENFKPISTPLVYCGKNSLTIMAVHYGILFETARIIDKHLFGYETYIGERTIIYFFVAAILQILIIEFINRKIPFIIGK